MCLWKFSWNFRNFSSIFRAFKTISRFSGIVFALKINSKKNKSYPFGLGRARKPNPIRSASAQPRARWSPSGLGVTATRCSRLPQQAPPPALGLGVRATPGATACHYKGADPEAARALDAATARAAAKCRRTGPPRGAPPPVAFPDLPALLTTGASGRDRELRGAEPHV
jgi:hypothetical protein